jgi:hypothetical protein
MTLTTKVWMTISQCNMSVGSIHLPGTLSIASGHRRGQKFFCVVSNQRDVFYLCMVEGRYDTPFPTPEEHCWGFLTPHNLV